ncbi:S26 family signal peptidase [Leifsonia sp. LS1]|uniref:signal peptidase I n=1 Tax=Leifsonia sp. LS1 TaxID=2828483 RepID=UPI001CFD090F|nr:signal peptidase I [Leifsonia sp. LS1]GIT78631.1 S26 family signal peptidase [Leifsonia sp. LS1]
MSLGWRIYAVARNILLTVGAVVGAACVVIVAIGLFLGAKPAIVISGSMEPTIPVGAMTFSLDRAAVDLKVGDVVMVDRPNDEGLVTHRIVSLEKSGGRIALTLQGDANAVTDPEPYVVKNAAVVVFTVPYLGYVADFLQRQGILVGIVLVCLIGALLVLDPAKFARRPDESGPVGQSDPVADNAADSRTLADEAGPDTAPEPLRSGRRALRKESAR